MRRILLGLFLPVLLHLVGSLAQRDSREDDYERTHRLAEVLPEQVLDSILPGKGVTSPNTVLAN